MSIDLARESPLFDKQWLIQQCQGNSESRAVPLSFRIIPGTRATAASGQTERLIHFEVQTRGSAELADSTNVTSLTKNMVS